MADKIDPYLEQSRQNRQRFLDQGNNNDNYLNSREQYYNNLEEDYRGQGDRAFEDLARQPGYDETEAAAIKGDPRAGLAYYNPDRLVGDYEEAGRNLGGSVDNYRAGLSGAAESVGSGVRGAAGSLGEGLRSAAGKAGTGLTDAAGRARQNLTSAADDELNWQGGVYNYLRGENEGGYSDLDSGLTDAIDRDKLALSGDFAEDYQLTPQQAQNIKNVAGNTVRGQYQKMSDEAEQRAAAGGNTSPAALAAIKANLARQGAIDAGDSMSAAELRANTEAANRRQTLEDMRLGTEQDISGRLTGAAGTRYGARTGAAKTLSDTEMAGLASNTGHRLTAGQTAANLDYDAALTGGKLGYDAEQAAGQAALDAEKTAGDYGYRAADAGGQAGIDASKYSGSQKLATDTDIQKTGQGLATAADTASSGRATGIANQRIAGQDKVRGYYTGQQGQAQQGTSNATGQQIQSQGTLGGLANQATSTGVQGQLGQNQVDKQPGEGERIGTGLLKTFFKDGGIVDSPTNAVLGEYGPEMVVKLAPGSDTRKRYRMAA